MGKEKILGFGVNRDEIFQLRDDQRGMDIRSYKNYCTYAEKGVTLLVFLTYVRNYILH